MIGMPRNGFKISRSLSPEMIRSALPDKANSRNMLSFESRQIANLCPTEIILLFSLNSYRNSSLVSISTYLSNFSLVRVKNNSLIVTIDDNITCSDTAKLNVAYEVEFFSREALIRTLLSNMIFNYSSFNSSSRILGVKPFLFACWLISSITSSKFLLLLTKRSNSLEMVFFSEGDILPNFSAVSSLTSIIIFLITKQFLLVQYKFNANM